MQDLKDISMQQSQIQISEDEIQRRINTYKDQQYKEESYFSKFCTFCTIEYYREYFEVTSEIVIKRFLNTFNPFSGNFFDIGAGIPDLYGPFWILNSLIFSIALSENIGKYLTLKEGETFEYQYKIIPLATTILYLKTVIIPMIYRVTLKCYKQDRLSYIHCLCIYGYSAAVMIPVSLLNCIPNPAIQWMLLLYVIFAQTSFLVSNFNFELRFMSDDKKYIVVGCIASIQILLMVFYKFYFFKHENYEQLGLIKTKPSQPSSALNEQSFLSHILNEINNQN